MNTASFPAAEPLPNPGADRLGVFASVVCAIHCLITPPLLIMAPAFGRAWSHPASHWLMALVVVPIAIFTVARGFRRHGRNWVLVASSLGVALILAGAALPALTSEASAAAACDACCPSLQTDAAGITGLAVPPAAIVTTLGGAALVLAHLGNLACCRRDCRSAP